MSETLPFAIIKHRNKINKKILSNLPFNTNLLQLIMEYTYNQPLQINQYKNIYFYTRLAVCVIDNQLAWTVYLYSRFHKHVRINRLSTVKRNQRSIALEGFRSQCKNIKHDINLIDKNGKYENSLNMSGHVFSPSDNYTYIVALLPSYNSWVFRSALVGQKIIVQKFSGKRIFERIIPACNHYTTYNYKKICRQVELWGEKTNKYSFEPFNCQECINNSFKEPKGQLNYSR